MPGTTTENSPQLIFTVMPKINSKTISETNDHPQTVVENLPTPTTNNPTTAQPYQKITPEKISGEWKQSFLKILKTVAISLISVILAGGFSALGYYGWNWWKNSRPPESSASQDVNKADQPKDQETTEETPPQDAEYTKWLEKYFSANECSNQNLCGLAADPDNDGLGNVAEISKQTDPNNPDSDGDGLSDGDEVNIFSSDPLNPKTANNPKYNDADFAKGGYSLKQKDTPLTEEELASIGTKIKQFGLHNPSIKTLLGFLEKYGAGKDEAPQSDIDNSPEARLSRDTTRLDTVKKIGIALYKHFQEIGTYPEGNSFADMINAVKNYNPSIINAKDPINQRPFVYYYAGSTGGKSFQITYQSETQNQLIRYGTVQAARDARLETTQASDEKRIVDLEDIRQALLIYSSVNSKGLSSPDILPTQEDLESALVPVYLKALPKDPKTDKMYAYKVDSERQSFTLSAELENPPSGTTRYVCTSQSCEAN